jgi:hypothetical protein
LITRNPRNGGPGPAEGSTFASFAALDELPMGPFDEVWSSHDDDEAVILERLTSSRTQ